MHYHRPLSNWKVCSKTPSLRRTAQWAPKKLNSRFMALSIKGASKDARIHMEVFSSSIKASFWKNICLDSLDSLTGTVNHLNEQYQVLSGKKTILETITWLCFGWSNPLTAILHEKPFLNMFPNIKNRVENMVCNGLHLMNFEVFQNVVKHCLVCMIHVYVLNRN